MKTTAPLLPVATAMRSAMRTGVNPYDSHPAFAARWALLARLKGGKSQG